MECVTARRADGRRCRLRLPRGFDVRVRRRAEVAWRDWLSGLRKAVRLRPRRELLKLDVGQGWRLLSDDEGCCWTLLSHAQYTQRLQRRP
ncbi:hypothetical protein [Serratia ureilytica]|jgi:hypothetical protein|uniref:ParE family toxin-like protein n=1 Tax=Serratia ureilytica TaxID=300181 RepID=UPI00313B65BB